MVEWVSDLSLRSESNEVRATGIKARTAKRMITSVMRAREPREAQEFMKVVVDAATERVLGAAILGLGDEIVHTFLDVMAAGAPYTAISRKLHIHPTVAEYLPTLFGGLASWSDGGAGEPVAT